MANVMNYDEAMNLSNMQIVGVMGVEIPTIEEVIADCMLTRTTKPEKDLFKFCVTPLHIIVPDKLLLGVHKNPGYGDAEGVKYQLDAKYVVGVHVGNREFRQIALVEYVSGVLDKEYDDIDLVAELTKHADAILAAHGLNNNKGEKEMTVVINEKKAVEAIQNNNNGGNVKMDANQLKERMNAITGKGQAVGKTGADLAAPGKALDVKGNKKNNAVGGRPGLRTNVGGTIPGAAKFSEEDIADAVKAGLFSARTIDMMTVKGGKPWYDRHEKRSWVPGNAYEDLSMVTNEANNEELEFIAWKDKEGNPIDALSINLAPQWMVNQQREWYNENIEICLTVNQPHLHIDLPITWKTNDKGVFVVNIKGLFGVRTVKDDDGNESDRYYYNLTKGGFNVQKQAQMLSYAHKMVLWYLEWKKERAQK